MAAFDPAQGASINLPSGQSVHKSLPAHLERLSRRMYHPCPNVWSLVGNGLSNQSFILAPGGLIVIDTGECIEEMNAALQELRRFTGAPVAAVLYTHFHYVGGTRAFIQPSDTSVQIYGHADIDRNLKRVSTEVGPAYTSGLIHQFGIRLPPDGPDGFVSTGLGGHFRPPEHAPHTQGYVPVTIPLIGGEVLSIAGLTVHVALAPSDSDDSLTYWFPELGICVQNLVWPTLFNIFPIRGEAYRDPVILLRGLDHILSLKVEHLIGAHGPPISGAAEISARVTRYRDAIQFLWDHTVQAINKGLSVEQMIHRIKLPKACESDYLTSEFYGIAEHHIRQISSGIRGWFDGDPGKLLPMEPGERANRLIDGLGGPDKVRAIAIQALQSGDLRWALELANLLVQRAACGPVDLKLLADILRDTGGRTTSSNLRNWCLTKARDLDGSTDLSSQRKHVLRKHLLRRLTIAESLNLLRVKLDAVQADGINLHMAFQVGTGPRTGLHIRNSISALTDGTNAEVLIEVEPDAFYDLLGGVKNLVDLNTSQRAKITGDLAAAQNALSCFDLDGLKD